MASPGGGESAAFAANRRRLLFNDGDRPLDMSCEYGFRAFSMLVLPDGRTLIGGHNDGRVEIRHPSDGALELTLDGHAAAVLSIVLASDSIFTAGVDRCIRQWSAIDFGFIREMLGHTGMILAMAAAPSNKRCGLFSAGDDDEIYQWNWDTGELVWSFKGHHSPINCLAATTTTLFAGCSQGKIYVHSLGSRRRLLSVVDGRCDGPMWALACQLDCSFLYSAGQDGVVRVWKHTDVDTSVHPVYLCDLVKPGAAPRDVKGPYSTPAGGPAGGSGAGKYEKHQAGKYPSASSTIVSEGVTKPTFFDRRTGVDAVRSLYVADDTLFAGTNDGAVVIFDVSADTVMPLGGRTERRGGGGTDELVVVDTGYLETLQGSFFVEKAQLGTPAGGGGDGLSGGEMVNRLAEDFSSGDNLEEKSLKQRIAQLSLQNNQLYACGFDGFVVRWNVLDQLTETQEIIPQPPFLSFATDGQGNVSAVNTSPPEQLHQRLLALDASKAALRYKDLPINYVIDAVATKVKGSWLTSEAMGYIPFVIMFLFFVIADIDIFAVYQMNSAYRSAIDKTSFGTFKEPRFFAGGTDSGITSARWWNQFFTRTFIPNVWSSRAAPAATTTTTSGNASSSSSGAPATSFRRFQALSIFGQNEIVGSIRIRVKRASKQSCKIPAWRKIRAPTPLELEARNSFLSTTTTVAPAAPNATTSPAAATQWAAFSSTTSPTFASDCFGKLFNSFSYIPGRDAAAKEATEPYACAYGTTCQWSPSDLQRVLNLTSGRFTHSATDGVSVRASESYTAGGYSTYIPTHLTLEQALEAATVLANNGFVDDVTTRLVAIEFFQYSPPTGIYIFHQYISEVYPGNWWFNRATHRPFKLFSIAGRTFQIIYDAVFFVYVLWWLVLFFSNMVRYYRTFGHVFGYLADVWAVCDLLNTAIFMGTFYYRWNWYTVSLQQTLQRPFDASMFPVGLEKVEDLFTNQSYLNAVNTVLTLLKVMKYAQLSEKLNLLTRTLAKAQGPIVGVLFLFIYFVFAFSLAGNVLYGENVFHFRTLDTAYNTLLRWLVGDMDYDALSDTARAATPVYFWGYRIVAQFILLSLLIAVLSDAFQEAVDERLPIPLDTAILRVAGDMRQFFLPQYLRVTVLLILRRSSRAKVVQEQLKLLFAYRESQLSEEAKAQQDFDELDHHYITKQFFSEELLPDVVKDATLNFLDEVWYDLAYEYHWRLQDANHRQEHDLKGTAEEILAGRLSVLRTHLSTYDRPAKEFSRVLSALRSATSQFGGYVPSPAGMLESVDFGGKAQINQSMDFASATRRRVVARTVRRGSQLNNDDDVSGTFGGADGASQNSPGSRPGTGNGAAVMRIRRRRSSNSLLNTTAGGGVSGGMADGDSLLEDAVHAVSTAASNAAIALQEA